MSRPTSYTLVFSNEARDDQDDILLYTLLTWGEAQMERYAETLENAYQAILQNPSTGRIYRENTPRLMAYTAGKHVIFYRIEASTIYIIRILHSIMDFPRHL